MRKLVGAHCKTSNAFLHLETGTLPFRFVIANRRLVYYYNILSKPENELIFRVFKAQTINQTKGEWFQSIKKDFELIKDDINNYDETTIKDMKQKTYKLFIKKKIRHAAFEHLENF